MTNSKLGSEASRNAPLVSVVMAVKNGADYIRQSLNSVIHQTVSDIEIIIINDGSDDNTIEIIRGLNDSRIRVYSQKNKGVARSANRGIALAQGKYIARIDHDDVWFPERLEKQVRYLNDHPEIALVGSSAVIWSGHGYSGRYLDHPISSAQIQWELLFNNVFVHSSILFRREIIKKVGLYFPGPEVTPLDDYHFVSRVASMYQIANLAERMVAYRETPQSLTSNFRDSASEGAGLLRMKLAKISTENISRLNRLPITNQVCVNFGRVVHQTQFNVSFFNYLALEKLLKGSIDRISTLSPGCMAGKNELLIGRLEELRFKWIEGIGSARSLNLSLLFIRDSYLKIKDSPARELKKKYLAISQFFSKKYWVVREFFYHKLYFKKIVTFAKTFRSIKK